ncbi:hypothetical protein [Shinella sp. HZN7]|uniref:hypothetical protein n=1 Tax=Shinella sp. (strain HZN7) TaxID=879274 RepID=UPI000A9377C8|nr:hypothetical protein [Shinella sp. HZN7]
MQSIQTNEFRIFTSVSAELHDAMRRHDRKTAYLALEEIRAMRDYSDWPALRARCNAALAEYSVH